MNPAIDHLPRWQRRELLAVEARARKSGVWGEWEHVPLPSGVPGGTGWTRDVRLAHRNAVFCVMERETLGGVRHLMISSLSGDRPSWWEAQRIKNELAGEAATAVEVYPPQSEVVDEADAYHLWVLTEPVAFGLQEQSLPRVTATRPLPEVRA